jgi:hypothetical protein
LQSDRIKDKEELSFWKQVQISNKIWSKIPGSQTTFEFELNLFEVQTCLENSVKFPKILTYLGLTECEFRLGWLYGKTYSFHTSSIWLGLQILTFSLNSNPAARYCARAPASPVSAPVAHHLHKHCPRAPLPATPHRSTAALAPTPLPTPRRRVAPPVPPHPAMPA